MEQTPGREAIQALLAPVGLMLQSVHRPKSGLTDSVFILGTDGGGFVLKVFHAQASDWKPNKERIVSSLLRGQRIPAPAVHIADLSRRLAPFAYTLFECLPGATLSEAWTALSAAERLDLYSQIGDLLGRIHSLTFDRFGDVAHQAGTVIAGPAPELRAGKAETDAGPFRTWLEMHRRIVRGRLAILSVTEFRDLTGPLGVWFNRRDGLLDYPLTPRLLHMDLHRSNILVSEGQVSGILDLEESVIGHNEYDLMRTELAHFDDSTEELRAVFYASYGRYVSLDSGFEQRRPFYELSRSLVWLTCLVRGGSAPNIAQEKRQARQRIRALLGQQP